jgi:short-subunit dehydrogenase
LAAERVRVVVSARHSDPLERLCREIASRGGTAVPVPVDLAAPAGADALAARAQDALGPIDLLVNSAAIEIASAYTALSGPEIERYVAINLTAPMLLIRNLLPGMLARGRGHVVNIASIAGKGATPYEAAYAATKTALVGLTRSLRAEYLHAPVGFSVVCPGFVAGERMYARMAAEGLRAPRSFTPCHIGDVVDAVITAIRHNTPEIIVTQRPFRSLAALNELFPRIGEYFVDWAGARDFFETVAERHAKTGLPGAP